MQREDLAGLMGRLLWGTPATRRELAADLVGSEGTSGLTLLAETARSTESWRLRARCLEGQAGLAAAGRPSEGQPADYAA